MPSLRAVAPAPQEVMGLEEAFGRCSGSVASVAGTLLGCDDEVDDVVQETFVAAMRGLDRLRAFGASVSPQRSAGRRAVSPRRVGTAPAGELHRGRRVRKRRLPAGRRALPVAWRAYFGCRTSASSA
jgi:hypothetical protein